MIWCIMGAEVALAAELSCALHGSDGSESIMLTDIGYQEPSIDIEGPNETNAMLL